MFPPNKILCVSDNNELVYDGIVPIKGKPSMYIYKYVKSVTKKGMFAMTENELRNYLKNNIFMAI